MTMGILDQFHALCNYILSFYYVDKGSTHVSFKQASVAWKSLFPFTDNLLKKLEQQQYFHLYGLCSRLVALVRYYIYNRMTSSTHKLISNHLSQTQGQVPRLCLDVSENLLQEYVKAERWYRISERNFTYQTMITEFPQAFQDVCVQGNVSAGISIGGEAGVSIEPMFPFTPYSSLHHAAIVSKCMLNEFVKQKKLDYQPIFKPEEFM
ncbi:uncharacterized protein B0P05DRAFT_535107 [Gilbertella persicaria]|uniref:uncharacterized protein n=1 Tax=Gilbertella persicaria TaxID=101096 RepID=UPI00222086CF|nr:uncharacterized protein B0P05DRAFT_535107 [Gilbertella persicaria]KAI8084326.1 hypothetical protein B0P05DRAFT_535107 [Gilbertella persicaria]